MTNTRRFALFMLGIAVGVAVWLALLLPDVAGSADLAPDDSTPRRVTATP